MYFLAWTYPWDLGSPWTGPWNLGSPWTGPWGLGGPWTGPWDLGSPWTGPWDLGSPWTWESLNRSMGPWESLNLGVPELGSPWTGPWDLGSPWTGPWDLGSPWTWESLNRSMGPWESMNRSMGPWESLNRSMGPWESLNSSMGPWESLNRSLEQQESLKTYHRQMVYFSAWTRVGGRFRARGSAWSFPHQGEWRSYALQIGRGRGWVVRTLSQLWTSPGPLGCAGGDCLEGTGMSAEETIDIWNNGHCSITALNVSRTSGVCRWRLSGRHWNVCRRNNRYLKQWALFSEYFHLSNAGVTFVQSLFSAKIFENHVNPVMLVFIGKLLSTLRWVFMCMVSVIC